MAKIQIKSEKLTPFGGIFSIMEQFDALLAPVSYTHLDVYKRQGWRSAPISVEKLLDEPSVGVKGQSNLEICLLYTSRCV